MESRFKVSAWPGKSNVALREVSMAHDGIVELGTPANPGHAPKKKNNFNDYQNKIKTFSHLTSLIWPLRRRTGGRGDGEGLEQSEIQCWPQPWSDG